MNRPPIALLAFLLLALLPQLKAQTATVPAPPDPNASFNLEIQHAIDQGLGWLLSNQHSNGWWSSQDHPAITALALSAFAADPSSRHRTNRPAGLQRGYRFLRDSSHPDGSIHRGALVNYNTALSTTALALSGDPAYADILRNARKFLSGSQVDLGEKGVVDTPFDGGVGYGSKYPHSDMNNTLTALEAIRATDFLDQDSSRKPARPLDWDAAIRFIQQCQNLPSHNRQDWVSNDPADRGGFVYYPGQSMAGGVTNASTGRVALRSYGSISYAGLLSYVYAQLTRDDPRVSAVVQWLQNHYTLEENPGMGQQGLYYYLHLLTKALHAARIDSLKLADGRVIGWRKEVALRLINLQGRDGSWSNANNRWWEKDPALSTAYSVLALSIIHRGLEP